MRSALPLTVAAVMLAAPVLAQNLAPNPGFEDGEGDLPAGWRPEGGAGGRIWADDEARSGTRSLKIEWLEEPGPTLSWTSDVIPITTPGQQFVLSVHAKLEGVTGRSGAFIGFYHTDENGERIGQSGGITIGGAGDAVAGYDWKEFICASSVTPEVKGVRVNLRLYGARGIAWFDDVKVEDFSPTPIDAPRPLRYGVRLGAGECAIVSCEGGDAQAGAIRDALAAKGVDVPILPGGEADLGAETRDLIVLGNLATSAAVEHLYLRSYTYEDLYYPGGGGYVLRPLVDPLGTGGNILVVGASDGAGLRAGVEALLPLIAAAGEVLEPSLVVQTGEGYRGVAMLPWAGGGGRRQMTPAVKYLKEADERALADYREAMLSFAGGVDEALANRDQGLHLFWDTVSMSWDLMEPHAGFSDEERLAITRAALKVMRSDQGYEYVTRRAGKATKENHATRGARAFYYGWRYLGKYFGEQLGGEVTAWRHALREFWQWPLASSRSYEDSLSQHALGGSMDNTLDIALQEPEWSAEWFASGLARRMGERCIAISNNMGQTVMLGDTNPGDHSTSVWSKLAWALRDGRYTFMIQERMPRATTTDEPLRGFNAGIEPVLPEDHLGLTVIPADELFFTTALRNREGVELEDAFDKLSFREGFDDGDEYLMIDGTAGGSHSYDDANSIGEFSANGRRWLVEIDVFNGPTMAFHNALTVARDGLGGEVPPQAAAIAGRAEGDGWAWAATRLPRYNGVAWTRHTLWMPGTYTVVIDEMTAEEPGDYSFVAGWRSVGAPSLEPGRFESAQDDSAGAAVQFSGAELYETIAETSGKVARVMPDYDALLYRGEEPGDFVEAKIELAEGGRYEVIAESLVYSGRGIVQVSLDGEPLGEPIDQFHGMQPASLETDLGEREIGPGEHVLRFEVVGRNPRSDGSYFVITAIKLYRPGEREQAATTGHNRFRLAWPREVPATFDRDTETLGNYLPISPYRDQALNIVEQSMSREMAAGQAACFLNAFCAWRGDDPALEVRRLSEHSALIRHAGEIALAGASIDGAEVRVGPLAASGTLFLLNPSRVILHQAQATLNGAALASGSEPGEALAAALQAAWEQAGAQAPTADDRWSALPAAQARTLAELPSRPLSIAAIAGPGGMHLAAGMADGTVACFDASGRASGVMRAAGPVHALEPADLDGDGAQELVVGSDDEHLYALAADMSELWRHRVDFLRGQQPWSWWTLGSSKVRAIHAANILGDARPELIVGAGNMRVQAYDAAGELLWRYRTDHGIPTTLTSADLYGDGRNLVLVGNGLTSSNGACWVLDESGEMLHRYYNGSWCTSLPAIAVGDLDRDGTNTVFTGSNRGHVRAYAPDQQWPTELWIRNLTRPIRSLTVVPREGGDVLAVGSDSGYLCAFEQSGEVAWGVGLSSAIPFTAMLAGHDRPLLAAGCRDGRVFFVAPDGEIASVADAGGRLEAMVIADVDGDGADEVVAATSGPDRVIVVKPGD